MKNNLKDILSNLGHDIEQDKLLQYLNNELSAEERHEVESHLTDDPFASDAIDGLSMHSEPSELNPIILQLNSQLKKQVRKKSKRKFKGLPDQSWIYFAVVLLLVLAIICYIVLRKLS